MRPLGATLAILLIVPLVLLGACSSGGAKTTGALHVVAGENFWGNIASQLGGSHVRVRSIISNPSADPHLYESDPRDAAAVGTADLVIENGLGYDDFLDRLVHANSRKGRTVLTAARVLGLSGTGANPHIWYDVPRLHRIATAIADALIALDARDATDFRRNLSTFGASLKPILVTIDTIKRRYPAAPVAYTEPVPGYLLAAAGLDVRTPAGFATAIEDGTDPSPADRTAMTTLLTGHRVRALLYNKQATSSVTTHIQDVARAAGVPVVPVTETLPSSERTYQSWQQDQANALLRALGG